MRQVSRLTLFAVVMLGVLVSGPAHAEDRNGVWLYGGLTGYGFSDRKNVGIIPLYGRAGWLLPDLIDEPLHRNNLNLAWIVEGWLSAITNPQNAIEVGVTPIAIDLSYDEGQRFVPFFTAGIGCLYTSLQGGFGLSGPFEFSSQGGFGVRAFVTPTLALSLSWRYRHISNAGIKDPNVGLGTNFILIGLESFPGR